MEALMQYVWQYRLWPQQCMRTTDGQRIEVLDPGILNKDAGPDFFNAKILIGGCEWAGNIEIHVRASDWLRHGHNNDKAYDSVVLHVVEVPDMEICRTDGQRIPQMVMTCARDFSQKYNAMVNDPLHELSCGSALPGIDSIYITDWMSALGYERLYAKADRIFGLLERFNGSWTDAIYVTLARALGFGTNAEPFELLAVTTPLRQMMHHADSLLSIEAMLFGQAGLLEGEPVDEYQARLKGEYGFLKAKFGISPSANIHWKMARMRPQNSPHRRIATLARMIHGGFPFSGRLLAIQTEHDARSLFRIRLDGYWASHCNFSATPSPMGVTALSESSVTVLLINVIVPVIFAYAYCVGDRDNQARAVDMLSRLPAESNGIVSIFERAGIKAASAFDTQALIQLRREYCQGRRCLFCRIGHRLLSAKVKR